MNIFVYSDESGVFDSAHNDIFVFGGVIFIDKENRDIATRKFIAAERSLRHAGIHKIGEELKACRISAKEKGKLFRALNQYIKFGVVVRQKRILQEIFKSKKSKQRYLDYAYKIALKRAFENLIALGAIVPEEVERVYVFVDEHTTATDGCYELKEALEQEFKYGTFNFCYQKFFPPIFQNMKDVTLKFCNSRTTALVRAADIVANKIYYCAINDDTSIYSKEKINIINLP